MRPRLWLFRRWLRRSGIQPSIDQTNQDIAAHRSLTLDQAAERIKRERQAGKQP